MKDFRPLALAAALVALTACNRAPAPAADHSKPASEPQTALGKVAAKGIEQARKELQTKIDEARAVAAIPMVRDARDMPRETERNANVDFTLRRRSVL